MAAVTTTILAALAVGTAAKSAYDASRPVDQPVAPPPPPTMAVPTRSGLPRRTATQPAKRDTLLTGPSGLTDQAPVVRKTLLGS